MIRCEIVLGDGVNKAEFEGGGSNSEMMKFVGMLESMKHKILKAMDDVDGSFVSIEKKER